MESGIVLVHRPISNFGFPILLTAHTYEKNKSQKSQIFSNLEKSRSRFFEIFEI